MLAERERGRERENKAGCGANLAFFDEFVVLVVTIFATLRLAHAVSSLVGPFVAIGAPDTVTWGPIFSFSNACRATVGPGFVFSAAYGPRRALFNHQCCGYCV